MEDGPFAVQLDELLIASDISERELMRQTKRRHGWGSSGTLSNVTSGTYPLSYQGFEAIASVLSVKPEDFTEYRMKLWRDELDPRKVGWERAFAALRRIET